jgi:hypothetical protein
MLLSLLASTCMTTNSGMLFGQFIARLDMFEAHMPDGHP